MNEEPQARFTFIYTANYDGVPKSECIVSTEAESLSDVVQAFSDFLRGSGFVLKGNLDIVQDSEPEPAPSAKEKILTDALKKIANYEHESCLDAIKALDAAERL